MAPDDTAAPSAGALLYEGGSEADLGLKARFLDSLGEAVVGTDMDGHIILWNEAAERLYGWRAEEVIGSDVVEIIAPADEMRTAAMRIMATVKRGRSWSGEVHVRHRDGRDFPVIVTNQPIFGDNGELMAMVGVSRDISGQRQARDALEASEARLDLVRRAAQSVIWEIDTDSGGIEWSNAIADVFGHSPDDVGDTLEWWLDHIHPDDRTRLEHAFKEFLSDDRHFWTQEYRFRRADGSYADVFDRAFASHPEPGRKGRIAGAMVDLTERRRLQDERRLLAQAGMILDLSLDYEATLPTVARLVTSVIADFCLLHLATAPHLHGFTTCSHADPSAQPALDRVAMALDSGYRETPLLARIRKDRESILLRSVPSTLRNDGAPHPLPELLLALDPTSLLVVPIPARTEILGYIVLGSDGTRGPYSEADVRMAEELARRIGTAVDHARLYEAEQLANRAKADFLAVMSHELRTPLTAVLGYADLLAQEVSGSLNDRQKRQIQRIQAGTDRLHRLMESILAYVRLETGTERPSLSTVPLADLLDRVREIVEPRAADESLEFRVEVDSAPDRMSTDPDRLLQVLLALLTNAMKFAREGAIVLRVSERDGRLHMDVTDSGPGIPEEHQPYVFNAFWQVEQPSTRRAGGAGLGLSVARRMARLMGGDVVIADSSTAGTTFRFSLPL